MKKFNLLFLLAAAVVVISTPAFAVQKKFKVPVSVEKIADPGLRSAGVDNLFPVTSTTPALATDYEGNTITDGFIHYVVLGATDTLPAGSLYLEVRSTGTANVTSTKLLPRLHAIETVSGKRDVNQVINFDPPIPFSNGLSLNIGSPNEAGTAITPGSSAAFGVGLRWKRQ